VRFILKRVAQGPLKIARHFSAGDGMCFVGWLRHGGVRG
jgi:hypothetical protein